MQALRQRPHKCKRRNTDTRHTCIITHTMSGGSGRPKAHAATHALKSKNSARATIYKGRERERDERPRQTGRKNIRKQANALHQ